MPEFSPGEIRAAIASMSNPTAKAFSYNAELYLGLLKAASSGVISFSLAPGETRNISFPVTMPTVEGIYPVYLDVYSNSQLVGAYQAVEDVVIAAPAPLSGQILGITWWDGASWRPISDPMPRSREITHRFRVKNTGSAQASFKVGTSYWDSYQGKYVWVYSPSVVIAPGEGNIDWIMWTGGAKTISVTFYLFGDGTQVHSMTVTIRIV